jgi:diketogulonate reductase-like aldo/keto reductase
MVASRSARHLLFVLTWRGCARRAAFQRLAINHHCTPAELFLRYTLGLGITPLTGTTSAEHMAQDLALPGMPSRGL